MLKGGGKKWAVHGEGDKNMANQIYIEINILLGYSSALFLLLPEMASGALSVLR